MAGQHPAQRPVVEQVVMRKRGRRVQPRYDHDGVGEERVHPADRAREGLIRGPRRGGRIVEVSS